MYRCASRLGFAPQRIELGWFRLRLMPERSSADVRLLGEDRVAVKHVYRDDMFLCLKVNHESPTPLGWGHRPGLREK